MFDLASDLFDAVVDIGRAAWDGAKAFVGSAWNAGKKLFNGAVSAVKYMASKVSDWKKLLEATWNGAKQGAKIGSKYGITRTILGGIFGGAIGGYTEYSRQAARQKHIPKPQYEENPEYTNDADIERLGNLITNFIPKLTRKFQSNAPVESFEEYLRISISMTFINDLINSSSQREGFTALESRFIELIDKLALDKGMSEAELQEFDSLVKQRYGKNLLLIGSNHLFSLWTNEEETCKQNVNQQRTDISRAEVYFNELKSRAEYNLPMTEEEKIKYTELNGHITKTHQEYEKSRKYLTNIQLLTGVAEGLLQQAEKENDNQVIREQDRKRADKAGAILVNMERTLVDSHETQDLPLSQQDKSFLEQYRDLHMPAAIKRQKEHAQEFVQVTV